MPEHEQNPINEGGGTRITGNLAVAGNFVGRDNILNLTVQLSGETLQTLTSDLLALLTSPGVQLAGQRVTAGERSLEVRPETADALRHFLDASPGKTEADRQRQYLLHLCVNPDFHQWQQRYVALSGGYRRAPELTPSYSAILVRGEGAQRQIERVPLLDIRDALEKHAKFILLAPPGAGKTTVLQRLALDKALTFLQGNALAQLPLFVRLSAQGSEETPHAFLARIWQESMPGGKSNGAQELREALRKGQLCLLIDAINEARRDHYSERMHDWRDFAAELPAGNQLIFSCRKLDYGGELVVQQVEIDPLSHAQIAEFAERYLDTEKGATFWQSLQQQHSDLIDLASAPFYLHMLVDVYAEQGKLPAHRARLFEQFVLQLFQREASKRHAMPPIDPAAQHMALSELAFAMQELGAGTQIDSALAISKLPTQVSLPPDERIVATPASEILSLARAATFLSDDGKVKFSHHLMQEYFAAEALLRRLIGGQELAHLWRVPSQQNEMPPAERGEWDPLPPPPTHGWEETTILAAGLYPKLYEAVQPINQALAARCLLESGAEENAATQAQSQNALLARLNSTSIHLRSRIEAGLLLGKLGDPRFPVETIQGVKVILPPIVEIAGGTATIGAMDEETDADERERPRHTLQLAPYAIGCFPVTNAEYSCFLAAGGYEEEGYWTEGGRYWLRGEKVPGEAQPGDYYLEWWQRFREQPDLIDLNIQRGNLTQRDVDQFWRIIVDWERERLLDWLEEQFPSDSAATEPRYWQDAAFNNPSQPVVGICWYEAMAYATWLASVTGLPYRLPSEAEWEWAASRGQRTYPWGNDWNVAKLNSLEGELRVMRSTPVGSYPQGTTADGIHELAGNVWEWTATRYADYPWQPASKLEDPAATGFRVTRGGGWSANRKMVRCSYRGRDDPGGGNDIGGFRLARTSL